LKKYGRIRELSRRSLIRPERSARKKKQKKRKSAREKEREREREKNEKKIHFKMSTA